MQNEQDKIILESISDGVFTIDLNYLITFFNRAAEKITGIKRDEAIGRRCSEVFRSSMCERSCALQKTIETKKPIINKECFIINNRGRRIPISVSTAILRDKDGNIAGGAETFRDLSEVVELRKELSGKFNLESFVTRSPAMRKILDIIPSIHSIGTTILIQGETGTGKEVLAKSIHESGNRAKKPFIAINCGALPDTLLESELFGYKKGAFTGAITDKPGRFSLAGDGTIFLDEIGEISPALQVRLLRVLQEKTFEPLGGAKSERTSARVIAATNRNLEQLVEQGSFREDLYYRINVLKLELPSLRQRKEDIPYLVDHFIDRFNRLHHKNIHGISSEALSVLMNYDWPGNIRELENVIERAFILATGKIIGIDQLPFNICGLIQNLTFNSDIRSIKAISEIQTIKNALIKHAFDVVAAAQELGIHKTTLYRKIKNLKIELSK